MTWCSVYEALSEGAVVVISDANNAMKAAWKVLSFTTMSLT